MTKREAAMARAACRLLADCICRGVIEEWWGGNDGPPPTCEEVEALVEKLSRALPPRLNKYNGSQSDRN